jgi:hypothetical protein
MNFPLSEHDKLIRSITEDFGAHFTSDCSLVYVGISDHQRIYVDQVLTAKFRILLDSSRMPDVVFYCAKRNWLVLIDCVGGRGCVDTNRKTDLGRLFAGSTAELVFVSAFPDREVMSDFLDEIAWETEAWVADAPSHIIHFNGDKFLGPH